MKCVVLAGGSGDRLWPISRKMFPKQFVPIRSGMSTFQETILRNIPFCDEFVIVTNISYAHIVRNQLKHFQDLKYSVVLESIPLKTAPIIANIAKSFPSKEELMIVSSDQMIDGDYQKDIMAAKSLISSNKVICLCVEPKNKKAGHYYVYQEGSHVTFNTKYVDGSLWDCGVFVGSAKTFRNAFLDSYLEKCSFLKVENNILTYNSSNLSEITIPFYKAVKEDSFLIHKCSFDWSKIIDLSELYNVYKKQDLYSDNIISSQNHNVEIINGNPDKLVVANDLKNITIVNTKDAVYVSSLKKESLNKEILKQTLEERKFFVNTPVVYYSWGVSERIDKTNHTKTNKLTIYPESTAQITNRSGYVVNYIVCSGEVVVETNRRKVVYKRNQSFFVGSKQKTAYITNKTAKDVRLIQIINTLYDEEVYDEGCFFRLRPVYMDYLWGGQALRDVLNKDTFGYDSVAEAWELSAHEDGQSLIDTGPYKGYKFGNFVKGIGAKWLGWKAHNYERFPLMIKFIDANDKLSIQVHPNDEYALKNENDYGKNEMWYIISANENSYIYVGFNKDVTPKEVEKRIKNKTLTDILNKVYVKAGETYYIEAGTVHAIGEGCLICEVQQSSNVTYRLYDYGRVDKNGKERELHIKKALQVLNYSKNDPKKSEPVLIEDNENFNRTLIAECKYFVVNKLVIHGKVTLPKNEPSFRSITVTEGDGTISNQSIKSPIYKGDTWFCGCDEVVELEGDMTVIVSNI